MRLEIRTVRIHDTGLGREAGYADDAELVAAAQAQRDALPPEVLRILERLDREFEWRVLNGESPT